MIFASTLCLFIVWLFQVSAFTPPKPLREQSVRPAASYYGKSMIEATMLEASSIKHGPNMVATIAIPETKLSTKNLLNTKLPTWRRRLDTPQDRFNMHKWAGMGWMVSSAGLLGYGLSSGFTEVPAILEPVSYLFVASTLAQSLTSIPMAIKYRSNEPSVQRGFISSAVTTSSSALIGFWLGPFGDHINKASHVPNSPDLLMLLVAACVLFDGLYNVSSLGDMQTLFAKIRELDPIKDAKSFPNKVVELFVTVPLFLPFNAIMLQQLWIHAADPRTEFLEIITSRGSSSEMVFYASMISSLTTSLGNLSETLRHRKLIASDVHNYVAAFSVGIAMVVNIRASGIELF